MVLLTSGLNTLTQYFRNGDGQDEDSANQNESVFVIAPTNITEQDRYKCAEQQETGNPYENYEYGNRTTPIPDQYADHAEKCHDSQEWYPKGA